MAAGVVKRIQKKLYFYENANLSFTEPEEVTGFDEYISDPEKPVPYYDGIHLQRKAEYMISDQRFASRRPDVMVYQTAILKKNITLVGPVVANLVVSTTGTDADYVVKLIDVYPDEYPNPEPNPHNIQMGGYQMVVRAEIMRGKFRNSFETPDSFTPGIPALVKFNMPDVSHCFRKGHRIMVQIQNSWFPLVDSNPQKFTDIYHAGEKDFQKATHRIYHDSKHASFVLIS